MRLGAVGVVTWECHGAALFRCRRPRHPSSAKAEGGEAEDGACSGLVRGLGPIKDWQKKSGSEVCSGAAERNNWQRGPLFFSSLPASHHSLFFSTQSHAAHFPLSFRDYDIEQDGVRRDYLANYQSAVLLLQTKVSPTFGPCPAQPISTWTKPLTFPPEQKRTKTSAAMNTTSPASATDNHVRSPIRATPRCASTRPSKPCTCT